MFDAKAGRVESVEWKLTNEVTNNGTTLRGPVTVTAHLMTADEIAAQKAKSQARVDDFKREHADDANPNALPPDTLATEVVGGEGEGEGKAFVSADRKPVIGFKLRLSDHDGKTRFNEIRPLFAKPDQMPAPNDKGQAVLLARPGYAVAAITVNAGDLVNAFTITFAKLKPDGLDMASTYTSPWYGKKVGPQAKRLGGDGSFVYGSSTRNKGWEVASLGLVMANGGDQPADDAKPADAAKPTAKP